MIYRLRASFSILKSFNRIIAAVRPRLKSSLPPIVVDIRYQFQELLKPNIP